jgi:hypothetical protein
VKIDDFTVPEQIDDFHTFSSDFTKKSPHRLIGRPTHRNPIGWSTPGTHAGTPGCASHGSSGLRRFSTIFTFPSTHASPLHSQVIKDRARPPFPPGCPAAFQALAARCWAELPEARPTAEEVEAEFTELQRVLCPRGADNEWLVVPGTVPGHRRRKKNRDDDGAAAGRGDTDPGAAAAAAIAAVDTERQHAKSAAGAGPSTPTRGGPGGGGVSVGESASASAGGYAGAPKPGVLRPKSAGARESRDSRVSFVPDVV